MEKHIYIEEKIRHTVRPALPSKEKVVGVRVYVWVVIFFRDRELIRGELPTFAGEGGKEGRKGRSVPSVSIWMIHGGSLHRWPPPPQYSNPMAYP